MIAKLDLAVRGGRPVRRGGWPQWPIFDAETALALKRAGESGRWTNSGPYVGTPLLERQFARAFAVYCGSAHCVPTDHGSSALTVSLEALGIGAGDEVLVPALTWVATATAVTSVNAIPVIVDIDPSTLCIDVSATSQAITPRTRAIVPVHLYCGMADMDALLRLSAVTGVPIIEDCAHVHGARWRDRPAGSLGAAGAFSMQQTKVLTCGEGGAVVTSNLHLARRMEQLRADSRVYREGPLELYDDELITLGELEGTNHCMSEFHAAVLLAQLQKLDAEHERRSAGASAVDADLQSLPGVTPLGCLEAVSRRVYYAYVFRIDRDQFAGRSSRAVGHALSAELGVPVAPIYPPLTDVVSYNPRSRRRHFISEAHLKALTRPRFPTPCARRAHATHLSIPHQVLLASRTDLADIAVAIERVGRLADRIPVPTTLNTTQVPHEDD
ncbi:MAG: DegT/DnrJ/EryC1/StrS family aminotransferase [Acidobacteriota bacterium]